MSLNKARFLPLLISLLLTAADAGANRIDTPADVYYHRFASTVEGPEAIWVNPAALGYYKTICYQYMDDFHNSKFLNNWGMATAGEGIGIAYRHLDDFLGARYDEYTFGVGAEFGRGLFWGGSYQYIKNGVDFYHKRHFWNIGLMFRENSIYSLGLSFTNLNRGKKDNAKTDIGQLYSLSWHPLGNLLILSMELELTSGQRLSEASNNLGIDINPGKGLRIYINRDNNSNYQLGFILDLNQYFIGDQGRYNPRNGHTGSTSIVGRRKEFTLGGTSHR
jgi:hypothetical protein